MPPRVDWDDLSFRLAFRAIALVTVLALVLPTAVILILSLTADDTLQFPPSGFSFQAYRALLDANEMHAAALVSLKVAAIAVMAPVVLGIAAALAIARSRSAWARVLETVFKSPLVLPALTYGFATLMLFSMLGIHPSNATLALGHIVISVPFVLRTTLASLSQLDSALLDCSSRLGASPLFTFRRVTLPRSA